MDNIDALGLNQIVNRTTHKEANTLDLILCDQLDKSKSLYLQTGPYFSDHCAVSTMLNIKRDRLPIKTVNCRDFKKMDQKEFINSLNLESISESLEEMLTQYNQITIEKLDIFAPIKTIKVTERNSKPWLTTCFENNYKRLEIEKKSRESTRLSINLWR